MGWRLPHPCREVLAGTVVAGQIKDTKAAKEVQALQDFMAMLGQVGGGLLAAGHAA